MKYLITTLVALFSFFLTFVVVKMGYFFAIDHFFVSLQRIPWLVWFFFFVTDVGSVISVVIGSLTLIVFLVVRGRFSQAICSIISLAGGLATQTIVKMLCGVERPLNGLVGTVGYSFPSGHANMVTILCTLLYIYVFFNVSSLRVRKVMLVICVIVPFLVGISRVYLNAHWASDVLAGWLFGIFWAFLPLAFNSLRTHFTTV